MHFWINKPAGRNYGGRRYPCTSSAPKSRSGQRGRRGREIGPMVTPVHRFQSLNGPSAPVHSGVPGPSATTRLQQQQHQEQHHQQQQQQQQHHHQQPQYHHHRQQQYHHHRQQQQQQQQQQQPQNQQQEQQESTPEQQQQQQQQQQQLSQQQSQQQQPEQQIASTIAPLIPRAEYEPRNHPSERTYVIRGLIPDIVTSNNVTNAAAAAAAAAAAGAGTIATSSCNNERQILPNETTSNGLNSRGSFFEGHFSEISDTELAGYRLRCGVWITFVLATGFVSVAKFYFGNRDAGLDMLIFCGLLFTLLLSGCFYTTLFRRAQNTRRHPGDYFEQEISTLAAALPIIDVSHHRGFNVRLGPQSPDLQMQQQQQQQQPPPPPPPPPPPYHIAILIPPANSPEEAPPPSYDKAMNEDTSSHTRVFIFSKDDDN